MKIIVNDANILIDLIELRLIREFFELEFEFYTTALIIDELFSDQQKELTQFIKDRILEIEEMDAQDIATILQISSRKSGLSFQDCSAYYQALMKRGVLITSDNMLRKFAKANDVEVHGHLWVFDHLFKAGIITGDAAC